MWHAAKLLLAEASGHNAVKYTNISQDILTTVFRVQAESYTKTWAFIKFRTLKHQEAYKIKMENVLCPTVSFIN
jgi:hypothetical protein